MTNSLVQIAVFASAIEAEHLRFVLQEHGVPAFVDGANTTTTLSHLEIGIGGTRLLVARDDARRACDILRSLDQGDESSGEDWYCGKCKEHVDAGFEVCWSCGEPREAVEQAVPATGESLDSEQDDFDSQDDVVATSPLTFAAPSQNPYAPPLTSDASQREPISRGPQQFAPDTEIEAMLSRAWRAAIIGLVALPILLNFYSMYLLVRASLLHTTFSSKGKRRFYQAWVINVVSGCVWGLIYSYL